MQNEENRDMQLLEKSEFILHSALCNLHFPLPPTKT